jgi:hypothetical protein
MPERALPTAANLRSWLGCTLPREIQCWETEGGALGSLRRGKRSRRHFLHTQEQNGVLKVEYDIHGLSLQVSWPRQCRKPCGGADKEWGRNHCWPGPMYQANRQRTQATR